MHECMNECIFNHSFSQKRHSHWILRLERCKSWNPKWPRAWKHPPENTDEKANAIDVCESCRSRKILQNDGLVAKIGFDAAENELSKVCRYQPRTPPTVRSSALITRHLTNSFRHAGTHFQHVPISDFILHGPFSGEAKRVP